MTFLLYKTFAESTILKEMTLLPKLESKKEVQEKIFSCVSEMIQIADKHGFYGNIWNAYLTFLLINDENIYSQSCEMIGSVEGSVNEFVMHDFQIIQKYYDFDLKELAKILNMPILTQLCTYTPVQQTKKQFNERISKRICTLSEDLSQAKDIQIFKNILTTFYKEYGVGTFGLHKAFRIAPLHLEQDKCMIQPITNITHVQLEDLIGYDIPKQQLIDNTKAFVEGKKANNCLLFGDAGTGKSTCVKAILNQYYEQGLRMIEVYKHQFESLNDVITQIKNRNYKFIIYMDDLSFEDFEVEYKYLKAVIEGGLEKKPQNILIYATSNRRHLIQESFADRKNMRDDVHTTDTMQEKLSLASRFGESIFFNSPTHKEFQEIVKELAKRNGIDMAEEELLLSANKWEMSHSGKSGRTAQQFIDHLLGTLHI